MNRDDDISLLTLMTFGKSAALVISRLNCMTLATAHIAFSNHINFVNALSVLLKYAMNA